MKKFAIFAVLIFVIGLVSSCKKDWDCKCTYPEYSEMNEVHQLTDLNKSDAEEACDALDAVARIMGGNCELD